MLTLLAAAALTSPQPGTLQTFGDWTVGCDNGWSCQAVALLPNDGADGATLAVRRGAEANARPEVWVTLRIEGAESPEFLGVDGRRFALALEPVSQTLRARNGAGVAALLGQATRIEALDRNGRVLARVSGKGSAAALLAMDAAQRRLGTTGALVRRGSATRVPPPPALPVIAAPTPSPRAARTLTQSRVRQLLGRDNASCEYAQPLDITTARLDAGTSLVLSTHPCGNGAYNVSSTAFLVNERGVPRRALYDDATALDREGMSGLINADWNPATRRLSSFTKARGVGDCGVGQTYAWDGTRFRLVHAEAMGECRGSTDYITTWRARVVKR